MESTTLYFKQGSSDKVYQACIEPVGDKYSVNFAYGRRGSTPQMGTKTPVAVNLSAARAIYEKLIKEKTSKGYTQGEDGTPYQCATKTTTGFLPQLLNPVGEEILSDLLNDEEHLMQEKWDGRRLLIQKQGTTVTGINKLGMAVGLPSILVEELLEFRGDCLIDGEIVGVEYHVFDVLSLNECDLRSTQYCERYLNLMNLIAAFNHPHIGLVQTAHTPKQKQTMFQECKLLGKEGVVFKRMDAPYTSGRPNSGGSQFKFKFVESASFIVSRINEKRSVSLLLFDGDKVVPVGNVTIPPNHEVPSLGAVVEVRYLYAYKGGSIYQPVFLGVRDDITTHECTIHQLKYKAEEVAA